MNKLLSVRSECNYHGQTELNFYLSILKLEDTMRIGKLLELNARII